MKKIFYLISLNVLLLSCSYQTSNEIISKSNKIIDEDVATRYFENRVLLDYYNTNARSISSDDYPSILYDLTILDNNGNIINFVQLSEQEKAVFYSNWKKEYIEQLQEKIIKYPDLREALEIDNEVMDEVLDTAERSATNISQEKLLKKYINKLEDFMASSGNDDKMRAANKYTLDDNCLNQNTMDFLKKYYKKGYILATTDNGSSSSAFLGHASLLSEDAWNSTWNNKGLSKVAYTAWPTLTGQMTWEGKENGVQKEPIAVWAGNKKGCVGKVKILLHRRAVQDIYGNTSYEVPSDTDFDGAVGYAESMDGVKYSVVSHLGMDDEERFYCSKLVQKSFLHVSEQFKFSNLFWTTPGDLISAKNTVILAEYDNQNNK